MNAQKKELIAAYKERKVVGGVYAIKNTLSGRRMIEATTDMCGSKNRFDFAQRNNLCVNKKIEAEWKKLGAGSFAFEVLEELEKEPAQTSEKFQADVAALKELWLEKLSGEDALQGKRIKKG